MTVQRDWIADAVQEILNIPAIHLDRHTIRAAIEQHIPFKLDVAYVEYKRHAVQLDVARIAQIREDKGWDAPNADNIDRKLLMAVGEIIEAQNELRAGHAITDMYLKAHLGLRGEEIRCLTCGNALVTISGWCTTCKMHRDGERIPVVHREEISEPLGFGIELADAIMRLADIAFACGIDLQSALVTKMDFNAQRPHHHGGKKF